MKRNVALAALLVFALSIMFVPIAVNADIECPGDGSCIETMPKGSTGFSVTYEDNSPAVWVGGDFIVDPHFAESEGVHVILGDMLVQNEDELLGIGVVGVGSGILPTHGSVMLAVGGDLTVKEPTEMKIGAPVPVDGVTESILAIALIGGTVTGNVIDVYDEGIEDSEHIFDELGTLAVSHWAGFKEDLIAESVKLKKMDPTGDPKEILNPWDSLTFKSTDSDADLQVFDLTEEIFTAWENKQIEFEDIPVLDDGRFCPIVINVYGKNPVFEPTRVEINGERVDVFGEENFGNAASAILWNFVDADTLTITGTSQFMGSIIAPYTETVNISVHTNGRLYVNGDLTRSGDGTEHHNFPWRGGEWYFACNHEPLMSPPDPTATATSLIIRKTWEPHDGGEVDTGWTATFTIEGDDGYIPPPITIVGNRVATVSGLPPGEYTITETEITGFSTIVSGAGVATESSITVVLIDDSDVTVEFVNKQNAPDPDPDPDPATPTSLIISKTWIPLDGGEVSTAWKAEFNIENSDGVLIAEKEISGNGMATVTDLSPGEYTITETTSEGFTTTVSGIGVSTESSMTVVTISESDSVVTVEFVNKQNAPAEPEPATPASLIIRKIWDPLDIAEDISGWKATFTIEKPDGVFLEPQEISGNGMATVSGLLPGVYTITEIETDPKDIDKFGTTFRVDGAATESSITAIATLSGIDVTVVFMNVEIGIEEDVGAGTYPSHPPWRHPTHIPVFPNDSTTPETTETTETLSEPEGLDESEESETLDNQGGLDDSDNPDDSDDTDDTDSPGYGYPVRSGNELHHDPDTPNYPSTPDASDEYDSFGMRSDSERSVNLPITGLNSIIIQCVIVIFCSTVISVVCFVALIKAKKGRGN